MNDCPSKHFATIGARQIQYRRAGAGPPVLLLHQSPTSSAELLPLLRDVARRFTVIAPDMPGYGASDKLPDAVLSMAALVANLASFMDVLGIDAAALYGFHTGASLATAFARHHPRRVIVVVAEGLLCLDAAERHEYLRHYLEPFVPRWDGGHLAWLWSRMKDQSVFFPWYERLARSRLAIDAAPSTALFARTRDWLRSGSGYAQGYAAAMNYDPRDDLAAIGTPHYIVCQRGDPLALHLARLPRLPDNFRVETFGGGERARRLLDILTGCGGWAPAPAPVPTSPIDGQVWHEYVGAPGAQLRVLRAGAPGPRTVVIQHGAQASVHACRELVTGFGRTQPAIAVELPGHGESDASANGDPPIEELARRLHDTLADRGVSAYDVVGIGVGAAIGVELLHAAPQSRGSLTLVSPVDLSANEALRTALLDSYAAPQMDSHGGYLLQAWHEVRDHQLFFPWFERRRDCAAADTLLLDPGWLHERTADLLEAGDAGVAARRAELRYPLLERLDAAVVTPRYAAPPWEPRLQHVRSLAIRSASFLELDSDMHEWPRQLSAAYDGRFTDATQL